MAKILDGRPSHVLTNEVIISYPHVIEPRIEENGDKKYSVCILIPKSDEETIACIRQAIRAASEAGKDKFGGKVPAAPKTPLRDGDEALASGERSGEEFAGHYFLNASSTKRPMVLNRERQPITDPEEVYGGCKGFITLNFFAYSANGNRGIGAGLNGLLKSRDGERLGGAGASIADFADINLPGLDADDLGLD